MSEEFDADTTALTAAIVVELSCAPLPSEVDKIASAISSALLSAVKRERDRCLSCVSGEITSISLGDDLIAKDVTTEDAIAIMNVAYSIARASIKADGNGRLEESDHTVDVREIVASIRARGEN